MQHPFIQHTQRLLDRFGSTLLQIAADSIRHGLSYGGPPRLRAEDHAEDLRRNGASFVTLHRHGRLRGCIGTVEASRPLVEDVACNAYAAAFCDPRYPPLSDDEDAAVVVSISVLSEPVPLSFASEADLLSQLRPCEDGLIIRADGTRALFLPQVWKQLPTAEQFLSQLKLKAGLPETYWSDELLAWRFVARTVSAAPHVPPAPASAE